MEEVPSPDLLSLAKQRVALLQKEREEIVAQINQLDTNQRLIDSQRQAAVTRIVGVLASLKELEALCGLPSTVEKPA